MPDRTIDRPHGLSLAAVALAAATDPRSGLAPAEADRRLAEDGPNELVESAAPSLLRLIAGAIREPFVLLLLVAGLAAVGLGEVRDGLLVLLGLVPIVGADVITEYRADRALDELRAAAAPVARVRRGGTAADRPARELVVGDVVLVRTGDIVPADLRLTVSAGLSVDRSALTGESLPEPASVDADPSNAPLIDRHAVVYAGTSIVGGAGEGIVVAVGAATETGRIAGGLTGAERRRSPLQRELDRLVRILLVVAVGLVIVTVGLGFLRGNPPGANLLAGISAAIAAIPEEPPILLAVILGFGAHRLLRRGVLVRRLSAGETLGAVSLILTDKTGTLTENRLALVDVLAGPPARGEGEDPATSTPATATTTATGAGAGPELIAAVVDPARRLALAGDALRAEEDAWRSTSGAKGGSFTRALRAAIEAMGGDPELDPADLIASDAPTERRPYALTTFRADGATEEAALGAPERVLDLAPDLPPVTRDAWLGAVRDEASRGRRLLLHARRGATGAWQPVSILAFADPLRDGVRDALDMAREAGIRTIIVTGDHPVTAVAIARDAGLGTERIVSGSELDSWDDERLDAELPTLHGVARAVPEQKLRLVDAARRAGLAVAVTGDGVNDAPALQHADVAVAMGSGTAVAKGASDLVLGDDSFTTLLFAVRDGRRIVANVRKGLVFLVSTHVALLGFILIATIAGFSQPLLPIQILWLELFIDLSTSVAFEREPEEPDAMRQPPRGREEPLIPVRLLLQIAAAGGFSAVAALGLLVWQPGGFEHARWLAFTGLVVGQAVRAYANRSLTTPVGRLPPNLFLLATCIAVVAIQALIPGVAPLAEAFRAVSLGAVDWLVVAAIAFAPALVADIVRRITHRSWVA